MDTSDRTHLDATDFAYFPWVVVEVKRESKAGKWRDERCYCQAANAALDIRSTLFDEVCSNGQKTVPPVVAFTCVEHIVTVWLMYLELRGHERNNKPIRVSCTTC